MYKFNRVLDLALLFVIGFYLVLSPFSKVEESFNIQAIHDIINYGVYPMEVVQENYDHVEFPGAVPRTFIGSAVIGGFVKLFQKFVELTGLPVPAASEQLFYQVVARSLLGFANWWSLTALRDSINAITFRDKTAKTKGVIGFWYSILLLSQFHLLYYSTRTLPNFIALPGVLFAFSKILRGDMTGLTWLAFIGIIFRLEVGLFAGIIALVSSLVFGQSNIFINVIMLVAGTVAGLATSVFVDSYFWGYWVLPEIFAFKFNVVEGNSSAWGVEPFNAYFNKYLWTIFRPPVILLLSIPGIISDPADDGTSILKSLKEQQEKAEADEGVDNKEPPKVVTHPARNSLRILFISSILFIVAMSFQPHKEWRFIIYVAPIFTLQAANGLTNISIKWSLSFWNKLLLLFMLGNVLLGSILSLFLGYASSFNYPGGEALAGFNNHILQNPSEGPINVHLGVAACMTGASRFGQIHDDNVVLYDKTENELDLLRLWNTFDYIVTESDLRDINGPQKLIPFEASNWEPVFIAQTFAGVSVQPIISLLEKQKENAGTLFGFTKQIIAEVAGSGSSPTFLNFVQAMVIKKDYLYVLKRTSQDQIDPELLVEVDQDTTVEQEVKEEIKEEVEVDLDEVHEEINEEIDNLEDAQ